MNHSRTFYYVESAPQILSAYKQIRQSGAEQFDMLVRLNGRQYNDGQIQQILKDLSILKLGNVSTQLIGFRFLVDLLRFIILRRYTDFCIADIRSPIALGAIVLARCKRIILLDDGTASFTYYQRKLEGAEMVGQGFVKGILVKLAAKRLKKITLHTMLPLKPMAGMLVEHNSYRILPTDNPEKIEIDERLAVFIGSKVIEVGICNCTHFDAAMKKFTFEFKGFRLIYVPHREEGLEKLRNFPEVEILRLSRPLELEFGFDRPFPSVVCTFYSAGIIHFCTFKDKILLQAYDIPLEPYNCNYHHSIANSKLLFTEVLGIKVVDFN